MNSYDLAPVDASVLERLKARVPALWANPSWKPVPGALDGLPLGPGDLRDAEDRLRRFAGVLADVFPEARRAEGRIDSPLVAAGRFAGVLRGRCGPIETPSVLIKCDHALPVAGSIKARGGFYAVLRVAETLALEAGILQDFRDDPRKVLSPEARRLFGGYELTVGSTGNLGLSIGVLGRALGFAVTVHMSAEAKPWKKARLRACGARVVEHASDYTAACLAAREAAERNPRIRFIDDENSRDLFLGYAATVPRLREQLIAHGRAVDGEHPVFIYLPCGVGGAPGGITWAARQVFGDDAHCFTAEPVEAPCMLLGMLTGLHADISVRDIGLDLRTDADGLAVARPSRFVGQMLTSLLSGCYTVTDEQLYRFVADLYDTEGLAVEPSAAAGCAGPEMILGTREGARYLEAHRLSARRLQGATHVVWTTGGSLIPDEQHASFRRRGRAVTL